MLFKEVIGHGAIKKNLIQTVLENRVSHAQLFIGREGTGSLPLAIAYAQYLNCTNKTEEDSCGECVSCKKYQKLIHPDLHFVFPVIKTETYKKPTSDDYIANWRELLEQNSYFSLNEWYNHIKIEKQQGSIFEAESDNIIRKLSLKSFEAEYKTMIIWKPEKMNRFSANRLLKLIEEPPPKTILLLVTSELDNILPTILSRTFQIKVPGIQNEFLVQAMKEKFTLSDEEIQNIIRISNGSFSEVLNNIEKSEENKSNFDKFQGLMRVSFSLKLQKKKDKKLFPSEELLDWVEDMSRQGREKQKSFLQNGLRLIRENFVFDLEQPEFRYLSAEEQEWAVKFTPFINNTNVQLLMNEFNNAQYHIERNANARIVFFDLALKLTDLIKK